MAAEIIRQAIFDATGDAEPHRTAAIRFFTDERSHLALWCSHLDWDPAVIRAGVLKQVAAGVAWERDRRAWLRSTAAA